MKKIIVFIILLAIIASAGCIGTGNHHNITTTNTVSHVHLSPITIHAQTSKTTTSSSVNHSTKTFSSSPITTTNPTTFIQDSVVESIIAVDRHLSEIGLTPVSFNPINQQQLKEYFKLYLSLKKDEHIPYAFFAAHENGLYTIIIAVQNNTSQYFIDVNGVVFDFYEGITLFEGDAARYFDYAEITPVKAIVVSNGSIASIMTPAISDEKALFYNQYFNMNYTENAFEDDELVSISRSIMIDRKNLDHTILYSTAYVRGNDTVIITYSNGVLQHYRVSNGTTVFSDSISLVEVPDKFTPLSAPIFSSNGTLVFMDNTLLDTIVITILVPGERGRTFTGNVYEINDSGISKVGMAFMTLKTNPTQVDQDMIMYINALTNVPTSLNIHNFNDQLTAMSVIETVPEGTMALCAWLRMFSTATYVKEENFDVFIYDTIVFVAGDYMNLKYISPYGNDTTQIATKYVYDGSIVHSSQVTITFDYVPIPRIKYIETYVSSGDTFVITGYYDGDTFTETIFSNNVMFSTTFASDAGGAFYPAFGLSPVVFNDHEIIAYFPLNIYAVHATGANYTYTGVALFFTNSTTETYNYYATYTIIQ